MSEHPISTLALVLALLLPAFAVLADQDVSGTARDQSGTARDWVGTTRDLSGTAGGGNPGARSGHSKHRGSRHSRAPQATPVVLSDVQGSTPVALGGVPVATPVAPSGDQVTTPVAPALAFPVPVQARVALPTPPVPQIRR